MRAARRVLILGGTTEASALARRLADMPAMSATLSLAGRTRNPAAQPIPVRVGGFGGVDGLRAWLRQHGTDRVIDATHPFAARMSANAAIACTLDDVPRAILTRPLWTPEIGDRWHVVPDGESAASALGNVPRRVFLPLGRGSLAPFAAAPHHHFVIRSIDPPDDLSFLPNHSVLLGQPPFPLDAEVAILRRERIDIVVAKNSGGAAAATKLVAAREMGLPILMIARPVLPEGPVFHSLGAVLAFIAETN